MHVVSHHIQHAFVTRVPPSTPADVSHRFRFLPIWRDLRLCGLRCPHLSFSSLSFFLHPWLELETWIQFLHIPFLFVQFILADPSPAPISHSCEIANYTGSIGTSVAQTVSVFAEPEFGGSTNANDLSAVLTQVDEAIADVTNTINGFNTDAISGYFTNTCAYRMMSPSILNI